MDTAGSGFHVGERVCETDSAAGDGSGDVEEWDADGVAAAFVDADVAAKGGLEFLAGAVILHRLGICFGVGEDLAGGIDYGRARTGGEGFLGGDVRERMLVVDFDAIGEE